MALNSGMNGHGVRNAHHGLVPMLFCCLDCQVVTDSSLECYIAMNISALKALGLPGQDKEA